MEGLTLFRSILTVLAVLLLAYYCSRLLGKRGIGSSGQRNLKVIEQLPVGQGRILLLKVGDHAYLVGVTHSKISLLTELEKDIQLQECYPPADGRGEKSALQKNLEKCAGNALDRAGEFLKKKADRFKAASQQGMAPYEILPGGLSAKEQPFQETPSGGLSAKGQSFQEPFSGGLSAKGQPFQEILQRSRAAAMQSAEQTFAGPESQIGQALAASKGQSRSEQVLAGPEGQSQLGQFFADPEGQSQISQALAGPKGQNQSDHVLVPERAPMSAALEDTPGSAALKETPAQAASEGTLAQAALERGPATAALERGPATAVPERAPADAAPTGPRPLEGGEEDG